MNGEIKEFLFIPADIVAQTEREHRQAQMRDRKRNAKNPFRSHHAIAEDKPFIFWDGEGPHDAGYALFGSSEGDEICHPFLTTEECLSLIVDRGTKSPDAIHVWYGGNYDVSMILSGLSWRHLKRLKDHCTVVWRGWRIEYVPRKWLCISNGKIRVKIYDVVSFFACSFHDALSKFKIGTVQERTFIQMNKAARDLFTWAQISTIRDYWREELRLGVILMNTLRTIFKDAGFNVTSWHGPGALARMALRRHRVEDAMAKSPAIVRWAAMHAFAGGRFELPRGGIINEPIRNADLRSAYPHYARDLPNLARGKWRYTNHYERGLFGLYHIRYVKKNYAVGEIFPLWRRLEDGQVSWLPNVEGWYHAPEAELVATDPCAEFLEGWVFDEDDPTDKPFAWIEDYYHKREVLKNIGNPAEFTFKLIINSVYGQLAQRTGWNKRTGEPPKYHQLEWAGYITSACRAQIYKIAKACGNDLLSIDTDGVYARCVLPVSASPGLGGWELSEYPRGLFWQSGIYALADESGNFQTGKTKMRGIPRGTHTYEAMAQCYREGKPLVLKRKTFTGFGLALNGQRDRLNTWQEESVSFAFGGQGKRYHNRTRCKEHCQGDVHEFSLRPVRPGLSQPHKLPWLHRVHPLKLTHDDFVAFDINGLDEDDRWVLDYAA